MTDNTVTLLVNGQEFGGWTDITIGAGIERMARDFSLGATRSWPNEQGRIVTRRVTFGDRCEVYIGGDLVMTGHVDGTPINYDQGTVGVSVTGRSLTADLVDCAALHDTGQIRGKTALGIAQELAAAYDVQARAEADVGPAVIEHQVEQGETVAESIQRVADLRQLLLTDDAGGNLVLTRAGAGRATTWLVLGENILSGDCRLDGRDRFSEYRVKGQRSGNDDDFGEAVAAQQGTATDRGVPRKRVLIETARGQATLQSCRDQARWHAAYRAGQSYAATYTVQGWRQGDGRLWEPNQLVRVVDPVIGFDMDLLIGEVTYGLSSGGMTTTLRVAPQAAWELIPELPEPEGRQGASGMANDQWVWREPDE